jgi:integrase
MSLYKIPDSEVWWASITVGGQRLRFSTGQYDRRQAQKVHDQRKAKQHDAPKLKGKTWGTAVLRWTEVKNPSADEMASLQRFNKKYHDRQLIAVTADSIEKVLAKMFPNPATFNRNRARIQGVLALSGIKIAIEKRVEDTTKPRDWLTREQWERLHRELPDHQRYLAAFALNTGLRQANVLNLTWDKVDLERKLVWVEGHDMKTKKPIPVPLNDNAHHILKLVQGEHPAFVFVYRAKPISEIKTAFQGACVRAGLGRFQDGLGKVWTDTRSRRPAGLHYVGFTWHGLRHTWATWHVQSGTPLEVLQKLGGWATFAMVERYGFHAAGHLANYVNNIGNLDKKP